ncbi:efflux RND transporter periplasmic adaptor subunit [Maribellus maritimus]|uniref:efflux RND transporter periplasmic adaptor subunit n=1 Tax=Maribellus maritimus TaxID=2870838 RepID=UPI001EEBA012|nr:efflux RND transporter periplasmic adaptor subunit [Maribellus maritimus]MCG6189368.1 efflux RND transporter periplasmic adaptor subunit [Maribellus maritimus]
MKPALTQTFTLSIFISIVISTFVFSCKNSTPDETQSEHDALPEEKNLVETTVIQRENFTREIVSNGKLAAIQKAELYFENQGIIETIPVKNGQTIQRGATLATLQNDDYRFSFEKAKVGLESAEIEKMDDLLSMGYKDIEEKDVPQDHLRIANIRSGYNQAVLDFEEAERVLKNATLKAPFSGKVEGVKQKPYEKVNQSEPFCTLISDKQFTIEFPLLETEFGEVQVGQQVTVIPVAGAKSTKGEITEINPRIDDNGLVWIKAEVNNPGGYLEGMNVKVSIKKAIPDQLVVPKQAVVLRQNREVLFRYTGGIAYWTYINVLDENESQYSVEAAEGATLEPGDTVIVSNNLNLAHESEVEME